MRTEFYLVIEAKVPHYKSSRDFDDPNVDLCQGQIKVTKKKPAVASNEIAMRLNIEIPDSFFRKPMLTIQSVIPEPENGSSLISAELGSQISEALQNQLGIKVEISAPKEEQ